MPTAPDQATAAPTIRGRALIVVAVVLLAAALRPAVNGMGAVIPELRLATGLSGTAAGLLLALPTLSFAVFGFLAPAIAGRFGSHRTVVLAMATLTVGQLVRALLPGQAALFGGSVLAMAGVALANVLLPGLVRLHFPDAIGVMTAVYTTLLAAGGTIASAITLPVEHGFDADWRLGIGMWVVVSVAALIPWLPLAAPRPELPAGRSRAPIGIGRVARTRLGWIMVGYFGTQALQAYVVFGWLPDLLTGGGIDQTAAALYVSLLGVVGVAVSAVVPMLLSRLPTTGVIIAMAGCYLAGYLGLLFAPATATWVWATLIGLGTGAFPVALTLVAWRARTAAGTTALSGFTQAGGYLLASVGPLLFGLLHDVSGGSWTVPLLALIGVLLAHLWFGVRAARTRWIEDELPQAATGAPRSSAA